MYFTLLESIVVCWLCFSVEGGVRPSRWLVCICAPGCLRTGGIRVQQVSEVSCVLKDKQAVPVRAKVCSVQQLSGLNCDTDGRSNTDMLTGNQLGFVHCVLPLLASVQKSRRSDLELESSETMLLRALQTSSVAALSVTRHIFCAAGAAAAGSTLQQAQHLLLHTSVTRDPAYSKHNEDDVDFFKSVLGGRGVVEDASALEPMNR